jgi:hypothetical protein
MSFKSTAQTTTSASCRRLNTHIDHLVVKHLTEKSFAENQDDYVDVQDYDKYRRVLKSAYRRRSVRSASE